MENKDNKNKGIPSPFIRNPFTGRVEENNPEKAKNIKDVMAKVKTNGLTHAELEEISKKMNAKAVLVIGLPDEVYTDIFKQSEFQFNSVGVGEDMTVPILEFVSGVIKHGYGKGQKIVDVQVTGGDNIPPEIKAKAIADIKRRIESGEIKLDGGRGSGIIKIPKSNDMADALGYAIGVDPAKVGGDKTINMEAEARAVQNIKKMPFWKRFSLFLKTSKKTFKHEIVEEEIDKFMSEKKEREDLCACGIPRDGHSGRHNATFDPKVVNQNKAKLKKERETPFAWFAWVERMLADNACPVCGIYQKGDVRQHIQAKAMWERRKSLTKKPYTDFIKQYYKKTK